MAPAATDPASEPGPDPLVETLLRLGDDVLILGQRLSEWCGRGPALEEDIALANTALDLIGQAQLWLGLAGEVEGRGRSADDLAMLREAHEFRNLLLVEQPNRDFGHTLMRQMLFDAAHVERLAGLAASSDARVAEIAAKAGKEAAYHLRRSSETVIALGDGTAESHRRMQAALDRLWPYTGEIFADEPADRAMAAAGAAPLPSAAREAWEARVGAVLEEATLSRPEGGFAHRGGRDGRRHSEHLGHLLATMQVLQRSHPGAVW
jgi:ring-1,2-phenylacetyl-CoA epoxidase subunit PaaC